MAEIIQEERQSKVAVLVVIHSDRRTIIRIPSRKQTPSLQENLVNGSVVQKRSRRRKSSLKPLTIALYSSVFIVIVSIIAAGYRAGDNATVANVGVVANTDKTTPQQTSVNEVVATTIAASVAEVAHLPVAANVANLSVSLAAKSEVAPTNTTESVAKQQIIQPTSDRRNVLTHTAKAGDTVGKVAEEYGVSKDTISWANNLTSDALDKGKKILVPPVDGIVYTVKKGDSVKDLADRYKASEERIVAFNDLELSGLKSGDKIVIPSGSLPETERPGYTAPVSRPTNTSSSGSNVSSWGNFMSGSVGNRYVYGYCTWYAYNRRAEMGRPVGSFWGNANTWAAAARSQGLSVTNTPTPGAIFQTSYGGGGYGHVGIIDSVDYDRGTVTYSDMNGIAGWNNIGRATISIGQAKSQWMFIP